MELDHLKEVRKDSGVRGFRRSEMKQRYHKGLLSNIFDDLFEEAKKEYEQMPNEYREKVSLHEHQENYVREQAMKKLNKY